MEINTDNNADPDNNPEMPLPTALPAPHFDATMISRAQQVEPLDASERRRRRPASARDFFRGRLGAMAVIMFALLLGAAALGMVLGLRDRRTSIEKPTTANQVTPGPNDAEVAPSPVKAQPVNAPPVKASARTQGAEAPEREPKSVSPPERVRRTVRAGLDDIDRALTQTGQKPAARKVGEIFGGGRDSDRRGRKGESRHRQRAVDEPN